MKHLFKLACLGAALVAAPFAQADTLNVVAQGTFGTNTGTAINGSAAGIPTAADPTPFTLVYGEAIFVGGSSPLVYCSTCLNFVFQFKNTGTTNDPVLQTNIANFGSFLTTEAYSLSGAGEVAPTSVSRTGSLVSTITYNFDPAGVPNTSGNGSLTDQMIIFTNATAFTAGTIGFADGTNTLPVAAYVPAAAATPEPSSLVLLGSGLVSAAGMVIRRRRAA